MLTAPRVLHAVRSRRRALATGGASAVRAEGDFELVSLPYEDGDVLRDLLVAEAAFVDGSHVFDNVFVTCSSSETWCGPAVS